MLTSDWPNLPFAERGTPANAPSPSFTTAIEFRGSPRTTSGFVPLKPRKRGIASVVGASA